MGYDMSTVKTGRYFRLNIGGMSEYMEHMEDAGMLHWHRSSESVTPHFSDFIPETEDPELAIQDFEILWENYCGFTDLDEEELNEITERRGNSFDNRLKAYETACLRARYAECSEIGIPGYKLCSNDGYLVTEKECREAVQQWEENGRMDYDDYHADGSEQSYWMDWIDFLWGASTEGGFCVY